MQIALPQTHSIGRATVARLVGMHKQTKSFDIAIVFKLWGNQPSWHISVLKKNESNANEPNTQVFFIIINATPTSWGLMCQVKVMHHTLNSRGTPNHPWLFYQINCLFKGIQEKSNQSTSWGPELTTNKESGAKRKRQWKEENMRRNHTVCQFCSYSCYKQRQIDYSPDCTVSKNLLNIGNCIWSTFCI